jgi:hypothetical protein
MAIERPAPLLIGLDRRHQNVELVTFWRPNGRSPKLLDLGERDAVILVDADRTELRRGPHQDRATVKLLQDIE